MINKIIFLVSVLFFNVQAKELSIGNEILGVDYILKNIDGNDTSLGKLKKSNGILVVFSCNTCPWVIRWQDRYNILSAFSRKNDIGFVAVNSNARLHESVDSMDEMIYHATTNEYGFPYVFDKYSNLAKALVAM